MSISAVKVLVPGTGEGEVLQLEADMSFWGSVNPLNGHIIDRRHPQFRESLKDRIILLRRSIGSSSGSAILLETLQRGCGPAGIILGEPDQILTLGAVIAREMGYASIPVLQLNSSSFSELYGHIAIAWDGSILNRRDCC
jgi:predicted aconitase with swiveling domain